MFQDATVSGKLAFRSKNNRLLMMNVFIHFLQTQYANSSTPGLLGVCREATKHLLS